MANICTKCNPNERWFPSPISKFELYLMKFFKSGVDVPNITGIRKNIAYNLQYLQFQVQLLSEFKVTQVILTQTWKVFIIVGTGIIETILYYLLSSKNIAKTTDWLEVGKTGNETKINNKQYRIENIIYEKLSTPKQVDMSFDIMIKKVENKKLLGNDHAIYEKLHYLRKLRNRVHLHLIDEERDSDWRKFNISEIKTMKLVLYSFMISTLFSPTNEEIRMFEFLK